MSRLIVRRGNVNQAAELEALETCQHSRVHEIGQDFDKDGMLLRLIRCQKCGLLMRQYLPTV
ncbi:MAG: hypothetical protein ABSF63_01790 [Candidatus Bathyarchaeia archaeon]